HEVAREGPPRRRIEAAGARREAGQLPGPLGLGEPCRRQSRSGPMKAPTPDQIERIERQVIGAAMLDPLACAPAVALAPSGRMLDPDHRDLMRSVERLVSEGADVTPATMEAAGAAPAWVSHCLSSRPDPTAVEYLASVLAAGYLGRESRTILARAAQAVVTAHDPAALIADVQRELSDLLLSGTAHAPTHISHAVDKALARVDEWERGEA